MTPRNNSVPAAAKHRIPSIVVRFDEYFGPGDLGDWQRLCRDIGIGGGDLSSKTKCRKVGYLMKTPYNSSPLTKCVCMF